MSKHLVFRFFALTFLLGAFLIGVNSAEADNTLLRTTFGDEFGSSNGELTLHSSISSVKAAGEQSTGKIIVVGHSTASSQNIAIQRYLPDGTLDTTFGTNGVSDLFVAAGATPLAVAIQDDDRIVVVGFVDVGNEKDVMVVRLTADGSADTTFNANGRLFWDDPTVPISNDIANDVAILPDGNIAISGNTIGCNCLGWEDGIVGRILPDGTPDPTFGSNGFATIDTTDSAGNTIEAFAVQADGKIVVTGQTSRYIDQVVHDYLYIGRITTSGILDNTFSSDGLLAFDDESVGRDIVVQADGKIVFGGLNLVGRVLSNGSLDTTFAGDGLIDTTEIPDNVQTLLLREDGHIFALGRLNSLPRLVLIDSDGTINPHFGVTGVVSFNTGGFVPNGALFRSYDGKLLLTGQSGMADPAILRLHPDGEADLGGRMVLNHSQNSPVRETVSAVVHHPVTGIYVAGVVESTAGVDEFTLQRFTNSGDLSAGYVVAPVAQFAPRAMAVDGAGRVVVVGKHEAEAGFHIRRYLVDGSLDWAVTDLIGGFSAESNALLIQPDNKIIVGGLRGFGFAVARFNENGTLDTTFGTNGVATHSFGGFYEPLTHLAFAPDGKIIAQGTTSDFSFSTTHAALTRFSADGAPDATFTPTTINWIDSSVPTGLSIQTDGKILSVGQIENQWSVWRQLANGGIDTTFGFGGLKTIFSESAVGRDVIAQPDGTIVSVGCLTEDEQDLTVVVRQSADGSLDTTFGDDGAATFIFGTQSECAKAIAPIADGSPAQDLIVVGDAEASADDHMWTLMRLQGPDTVPTAVEMRGISAENPSLTLLLISALLLITSTILQYRKDY